MNSQKIFITGGSGYIGNRLIAALLKKKIGVRALVRKGSEQKIPPGAEIISGNALDASTFEKEIGDSETFIHMIGVAHPSPSKKQQFLEVDLKSIQESVKAAKGKNIRHFIYISVAPNNVMKDYCDVRRQGEKLVSENFANATFLRPFYVLGPGHYWPLMLTPFYKLMSLSGSGREKAKQLGLVWIGQMVNAMVWAVENPAQGARALSVQDIKKFPKKLPS
jgi:nucleoside-diphosphate-sugar epimerase